jgi:hypothetical protein
VQGRIIQGGFKMNKNWISVKDKLPESGQEVLTYFYDEPYEIHQICMLTYYKKGAVIDTKMDRDDTHTASEKLFNVLYNKDYDIIAPEDGFYISEWGESGDSCYRKHADIITHWQALPEPPFKEDLNG